MTTSSYETSLKRGIAAHHAGRFPEAEACYREALALAPNDPEANSLLGLALSHRASFAEARPLLERAVELAPRKAHLRFNLVEGLEAAGELGRAIGVLHTVLESDPTNLQAWTKAGDLAQQQGDLPGAIEAWNRAHDAHPTASGPIARLARLELGRGKAAEAMLILDALLKQSTGDAEILDLWCQGLTALRQWVPLEQTASKWCATERTNPKAWRHLANAQFERGRYRDAAQTFMNALAISPPSAADLAALAALQLSAFEYERAADTLQRAAALDPQLPAMLSTQSLLHLYYGRFAEAGDCARRCLAGAPQDPTALKVLVRVRRGDVTDLEFGHILQLAHRTDAPVDERIAAAFAAAQVLDARDEIDEAFAACEYAQALSLERDRLEGIGYDPGQTEQRIAKLIDLFPSAAAAPPITRAGPRPIFIVGMPRSGTTLVEAMLGAHPKVWAGGERPAMRQILRDFLAQEATGEAADARQLGQWSEAWFEDLPDTGQAECVTDKHPRNLEAVGLIARLFPAARIVMLRRNPVETGFSIYRQEFSKHWDFAHRLTDIAHYCGLAARLIAHWERALPGRVMTVQYEDLATDFARGAAGIVRFCGLDWEPQCLDYAHSPRPVATFSAIEAREPPSLSRRAGRYRAYLGELVSALEKAGVDLETGGWRER
ncbi:MAG: sulfotransferase [Steroidobacteraceae bacterium]|nr:sulfotransferase [Steroidobacteraceae bacterium]